MKNGSIESIVGSPGWKDFGIRSARDLGRRQRLRDRALLWSRLVDDLKDGDRFGYLRGVESAMGRTVRVHDRRTNSSREMLMFASNNYLGLASDPYVREAVEAAIRTYGTGLGGPPLLCGYSRLMRELEERLSAWKRKEEAMIFSTGYMTNLGLVTGLTNRSDRLFYDSLHHASFHDAIRLSSASATRFAHSDVRCLRSLMDEDAPAGDTFIAVEGVYSMDGDLAPLRDIVRLARDRNAFVILDDAHGSGVLGIDGRGTACHLGVERSIDIAMGTFSKAFATTGGFVAASREIIQYLRFLARPYMFSAALPPSTLAAILAGLDVIESQPERRSRLLWNARYAKETLAPFGLTARPEAAIIAVRVPDWMDIRKASGRFDEMGIFLSAIEYPAVASGQERFRIGVTCEHTRHDIDRLAEAFYSVWHDTGCVRGK